MGLFTLGNVCSEATSSLGGRLDISLSRASLYANQALQWLWNSVEHDLSEAIAVSSTTSGENKITLPSDFQEVVNLSNMSVSPPQPLSKWNSDDIDSQYTYVAQPTNYVLYSNWLELWPSPDSSYSLQLRYKTRPAVLSLATATPSFSTKYDMAWLYKTCEYLADASRDYESAAVMRQKCLSEVASVPSDRAMRQRAREGMRVSYPLRPRGEIPMDSLTSVI